VEKFDSICQRACDRKGGMPQLETLLGKPKTRAQLTDVDDSRFLSEFSKKVFQSGFVWRVVEQKWPNFEELFWGFDVQKLVLMPPDMMDEKAADARIIRNHRKVQSIIENAHFIKEVSDKHGGFGKFIAEWPSDDIIGLWALLKKEGSRLGGNTGPYGLRAVGKDTFLLSRDVEGYFRNFKLIDGGLNSKRSLTAIQHAFNTWQQESGRSLMEISRTLAFGFGDNYV